MTGSKFVYVTFIRTSPEKLWSALTTPEFIRQYWFDMTHETDWKVGSPWKMLFPDGRVADLGEISEFDPPKRLAFKWRNEWRSDLKVEGWSRCILELEPADDAVKLTVTHTIDVENSKFIEAVSGGWPKILSNLKSLLETGKVAIAHK
ncbi:SRPBCC family protein [Rhizobium sp. BR 314]|uniref:SRPBCC family protein n=1 Tax=Rhizobium sp. BR 314 TaxID=3040013 RepID=UPI0039BF0FDC